MHFGEVLDRCTTHPLQAPKRPQQLPAPLRTQPGNLLEQRFATRSRPRGTVPGDREAVRFVPDALDEVQGRRVRREYKRPVTAGQEQPLLTGTTIRALGDADDQDALHTELHERADRGLELPQTTVDE